MLLTSQHETHLRMVKTANAAWREAKAFAKARAKILAEKEVASFLYSMDLAVRRAHDAGVPNVQIREQGLGTTSPASVLDSLARSEGMAGQIDGAAPDAVERFTLRPQPDWPLVKIITVTLAGAGWEAFKKAGAGRFRGNAHNLNEGEYYWKDQELNGPVDGEDRTTANRWDNPVTAWLRSEIGSSELEAWLAEFHPDLLPADNDDDLI